MQVNFRSQRLVVAPCPDADQLCAISDGWITPGATQFLPPHLHLTRDQPSVAVWCGRLVDEATVCAARLSDGGAAAGLLILNGPDEAAQMHLGYILAQDHWGKGLGTELVGGFVEWARQNDVAALLGGVEDDNPASAAILHKLGFEPFERRADSTMYRLDITADNLTAH